jgi:hypothetical protein
MEARVGATTGTVAPRTRPRGDVWPSVGPLTRDEHRVRQAIAWSERALDGWYLPLKRIATMALGGDAERASRIPASLDEQECLRTDTMDGRAAG